MEKNQIATEKAPKAVGAYSQGIEVKAERLYFFSGQIAIDPKTGTFIGGTYAQETERILNNVDALLTACGLTADNVVKSTVFLTDIREFAAVNEVYAGYFRNSLPARSCVAVTALPLGAKVEIEIVAARG